MCFLLPLVSQTPFAANVTHILQHLSPKPSPEILSHICNSIRSTSPCLLSSLGPQLPTWFFLFVFNLHPLRFTLYAKKFCGFCQIPIISTFSHRMVLLPPKFPCIPHIYSSSSSWTLEISKHFTASTVLSFPGYSITGIIPCVSLLHFLLAIVSSMAFYGFTVHVFLLLNNNAPLYKCTKFVYPFSY